MALSLIYSNGAGYVIATLSEKLQNSGVLSVYSNNVNLWLLRSTRHSILTQSFSELKICTLLREKLLVWVFLQSIQTPQRVAVAATTLIHTTTLGDQDYSYAKTLRYPNAGFSFARYCCR
jgi:hypothetical protein